MLILRSRRYRCFGGALIESELAGVGLGRTAEISAMPSSVNPPSGMLRLVDLIELRAKRVKRRYYELQLFYMDYRPGDNTETGHR